MMTMSISIPFLKPRRGFGNQSVDVMACKNILVLLTNQHHEAGMASLKAFVPAGGILRTGTMTGMPPTAMGMALMLPLWRQGGL